MALRQLLMLELKVGIKKLSFTYDQRPLADYILYDIIEKNG